MRFPLENEMRAGNDRDGGLRFYLPNLFERRSINQMILLRLNVQDWRSNTIKFRTCVTYENATSPG